MKLTSILTSIFSVVLISCGDINVTDPNVEVNNGDGETSTTKKADDDEEQDEEVEIAETENEPEAEPVEEEEEDEPFKLEKPIKKGMTKAEVLEILGQPDEVIPFYKSVRWYWYEEINDNVLCAEIYTALPDKCYVSFRDGEDALDVQEGFKPEHIDITSF